MSVKNTVIRITALLLFFSMIAAVILYQAGAYDISFIKRPTPDTYVSDSESTPGTSEPEPPQTTPPNVDDDISILDAIKPLSSLDGYRLSYNKYSQESVIAEIELPKLESSPFSLRNVEESKKVFYTLDNGRLSTKTETVTVKKPLYTLYFGYILVDRNTDGYDIYNTSQKLVAQGFKGEFVYALTTQNEPAVKDKEKFYEITDDGLKEINEEDIIYNRLRFDHQRYYGAAASALLPYFDNAKKLYGYKDGQGNILISPTYSYALPFFSDGYAAVGDENGNLFYINTKGEEVVSLRKNKYIVVPKYNNVRFLQMLNYGINDTISDLGMYVFDSGHIMVRYDLRHRNVTTRLQESCNRLYSANGKETPIPNGYSLKNYSEGVMLVEKDGRYGYMTATGEWILPALFEEARPHLQGLAVAKSEGKYGMVDTEGNAVLPFVFDYVSNVSSGVIITYTEGTGWRTFVIAEADK